MNITLKQTIEGVDWVELASVFERAPLGTRLPEKLAIRFRNSYAVCFAYDGDRLIGAARAISDGDEHAAVYDVILLPEYQGQGVGRLIMEDLMARLDVPTVILFAVPGKEGFYQKLGFSKMTTAMGRFPNADIMRKHGYIE
jgi:ribosomal protein S18 acetylase RimI-like enzyme